ALVQFSDAETATSAKNALDGRIIPRDYTNPYLPVAPSAIDGSNQFNLGLDGKKLEPESNVLLASIENMQYAVTLDVLHMVFSAFGPVQKIAMFDKNGALQALIQYPDVQTAIVAKEALEGHCIYDGGFCKLHLSYSRHTDLSIKTAIAAKETCIEQLMIPSQPSAQLDVEPQLFRQSVSKQISNHHNPYIPRVSMPQMTPGIMRMPG
ncbi:hypothetical protein Gotri_008873, partial [Gossypium trilobum]|nr:hypothetical protein [Gossypium trilobum]